jgi:hypothetical protein
MEKNQIQAGLVSKVNKHMRTETNHTDEKSLRGGWEENYKCI